jgi:hypothetical protein
LKDVILPLDGEAPSPSPARGICANLAGGSVDELRVEKIHLTTEAQRPQRRAIFLCLSGDADKHKSLSLYEATDVYCVPIQKAHGYINVQNIPEGTSSFHPVVVSRLRGRSHFGVAKARPDKKIFPSVPSVPPW